MHARDGPDHDVGPRQDAKLEREHCRAANGTRQPQRLRLVVARGHTANGVVYSTKKSTSGGTDLNYVQSNGEYYASLRTDPGVDDRRTKTDTLSPSEVATVITTWKSADLAIRGNGVLGSLQEQFGDPSSNAFQTLHIGSLQGTVNF